jgi:hypothetical protein
METEFDTRLEHAIGLRRSDHDAAIGVLPSLVRDRPDSPGGNVQSACAFDASGSPDRGVSGDGAL